MSGVVSRWVIGIEHELADEPGTGEAVAGERLIVWADEAVDAYLDRCDVLRRTATEAGLTVARRLGQTPENARLGSSTAVFVTASVTEVRPTEVIVSVRLRPIGGELEPPVTVRCLVRLEHPGTGEATELSKDIRDELIALEHAATHMN